MYYHNSVLAFVFGFGRGRLRAQKERLLGLIARPFLFPTLGAASADPNVLPRWAQSQMLIPNEDDNIWSLSVTARLTSKPVRRTRTAFSGISKFVTPTFTAGIALREYWGIIVSCVTVVQPSRPLSWAWRAWTLPRPITCESKSTHGPSFEVHYLAIYSERPRCLEDLSRLVCSARLQVRDTPCGV